MVLIRSKTLMTLYQRYNEEENPNIRTFIPIVIEVIRPYRALSWVITAIRHKPSDRFLDSFDEVHRRMEPGRMYWVCIRGGTLSNDAVNGLIRGHQAMTDGWEQIDLRQFD